MNTSPYILLSLTSLFWSLNFIIGKLLVGVIPPITINFLRWFPPLIFFLIYYRKDLKNNFHHYKKHTLLILMLGATGYGINSISVYEAVRFTTTINTSFINAFNPVLIAIVGLIMYKYPVDKKQSLGFIISLAGVIIIVFKGEISKILGLHINIGDLLMVGSILSWSVHTILYKNKAALFTGGGIFPLMMLAGLVLTFPFALYECVKDNWMWVNKLQFNHLLAILALNIFPSVLAYLFWNKALTRIPANKVAIFQYLIPIYTSTISVLFLGERLQQFHVFAGVLIFIGVFLVADFSLRKKKRII